jgi:uncharacterized protein (TIGR02594 family)
MDAPWLRVARELIGVKEVSGRKADPRIVELFRLSGFPEFKSDETAWCAAFIGGCLRLAGYSNRASLLAVQYLHFGKGLGKDPREGCVVVLKPLTSGASGHVGFYVDETDTHVTLLGGNQRNVVNERRFPKGYVRAYRWPYEKASIASSDIIKNITQLEPGYVPPEGAKPVVASQTGTYASFDTVIPLVLRWEGGYVNDPDDPGGATNMGITIGTLQRWRGNPMTEDDVEALTENEARKIYREYYWNPIQGAQLPAPAALMTFNAAVLHGPPRSSRFLQEALNRQGLEVDVDGEIGPQTLGAVGKANLKELVHDYAAVQLAYLQSRPHWGKYGRGWTNRVNDIQSNALALADIELRIPAPPLGAPTPGEKPMTLEEILRIIIGAATGRQLPESAPTTPAPAPTQRMTPEQISELLNVLLQGKKPEAGPVSTTTPPVLTPIDKMFPASEFLAGKKAAISVIAYVILMLLQYTNQVGTAMYDVTAVGGQTVEPTATGGILTALIGGLGGLGLLSKFDRVNELLGMIAGKW